MAGRLIPVPLQVQESGVAAAPAPGGYATLTRDRAVRLARAMPDCQSAVLLLLTWQATLHERMKRGRLARRTAASLSGGQLVAMTGCPLRTVRHALRRLSLSRVIAKEPAPAGRKNTYTLAFLGGESPGRGGQEGNCRTTATKGVAE